MFTTASLLPIDAAPAPALTQIRAAARRRVSRKPPSALRSRFGRPAA